MMRVHHESFFVAGAVFNVGGSFVAPRIVLDVSCVRGSIMRGILVAHAIFGDVGR